MFECNQEGTTDVYGSLNPFSPVVSELLKEEKSRLQMLSVCGLASGAAGGACVLVLLWWVELPQRKSSSKCLNQMIQMGLIMDPSQPLALIFSL